MAALNRTVVLGPVEIAAFRGAPQQQLFERGDVLCRFITRGENSIEGPWWVLPQDLAAMRQHALRNGVGLPAVARARLAVSRDWSKRMDFVVTVKLQCAAFGWVGQARNQPVDSSRSNQNVLLIGGMRQVYMPNLLGDTYRTPAPVRVAHVGIVSPRAVVIAHEVV